MIKIKTKYFFNSRKVIRKFDDATRRVFSRFGSFARITAKRSIRKVGKKGQPSRAGQPPKSRKGLLKKFIFYSYDPRRKSVVIGPEKLGGKGRGKAPKTLEYGGQAIVGNKKRPQKTKISARPYMGPAFNKTKSKLPQMWANSIKH